MSLVVESGMSHRKMAADLGMNLWTLRDWVRKYHSEHQRSEPARVASLEEENRRLKRENAVLRQEREILKSGGVLREGAAMKYAFVAAHSSDSPVNVMCRVLNVRRSGFYACCAIPEQACSGGQSATSADQTSAQEEPQDLQ